MGNTTKHKMALPLILGLGIAGVAFGTRIGVRAFQKYKAMPKAPSAPRMSRKMKRAGIGGFEQVMSQSEARLILNLPNAAPSKDIKDAHRKIMLMDHPDRGGSAYVATKVNQAKELLLKTAE